MVSFIFPKGFGLATRSAAGDDGETNISSVISVQEKNISKLISERIRKLIRDGNTTQTEVAKALDVTQGAVSGWCNGTQPRADHLQRLAAHFNVSLEWILTGDNTPIIDQVVAKAVSFLEQGGQIVTVGDKANIEAVARAQEPDFFPKQFIEQAYADIISQSIKRKSTVKRPPLSASNPPDAATHAAIELAILELRRNLFMADKGTKQVFMNAFETADDAGKLKILLTMEQELQRMHSLVKYLQNLFGDSDGQN